VGSLVSIACFPGAAWFTGWPPSHRRVVLPAPCAAEKALAAIADRLQKDVAQVYHPVSFFLCYVLCLCLFCVTEIQGQVIVSALRSSKYLIAWLHLAISGRLLDPSEPLWDGGPLLQTELQRLVFELKPSPSPGVLLQLPAIFLPPMASAHPQVLDPAILAPVGTAFEWKQWPKLDAELGRHRRADATTIGALFPGALMCLSLRELQVASLCVALPSYVYNMCYVMCFLFI